FAPQARRFLEEATPPLKDRLRQAVLDLAQDLLLGKPLKGELAGSYSYRVGDWRVIYSFDKEFVTFEVIRHRREVYQRK
ncbi:MAG TPA: type II toxin-antitoxin system RelE/ParE family toxin, partial [Anaerolineae bacterium]|nr:type II toxin-antitoxin system RelE/ParE family toxin [Anaerolineae bacterium]